MNTLQVLAGTTLVIRIVLILGVQSRYIKVSQKPDRPAGDLMRVYVSVKKGVHKL